MSYTVRGAGLVGLRKAKRRPAFRLSTRGVLWLFIILPACGGFWYGVVLLLLGH